MISENPDWIKRLPTLEVCQFVASAPPSALESYGLMVSALRELHSPMTARDSEINLDDAIGKELLTFALPQGFTVTDAGRFLVMTASTGAIARSIIEQIEDEK